MESLKNEAAKSAGYDHFFDSNKMRSLIDGKGKLSVAEKFKSWIAAYTKDAHEKIWKDIESYQSH